MPGELGNFSFEDYQATSHIHLKASGQMTFDDLRRELNNSSEVAKEVMRQEVDIDFGED
ncbi:MAG: hypothetical protein WCF91_00060 [bacterium]